VLARKMIGAAERELSLNYSQPSGALHFSQDLRDRVALRLKDAWLAAGPRR
jgi:hypothetical protein